MTLIRALLTRRRSVVMAAAVAIALTAALVPRSPGDEPAAGNNPAPTTARAVDPRAEDLLRAATKYLGDAKSLSFTADVWEDVVAADGRKLQSQRSVDVAIRRPDRVVSHSVSDRKSRDAYYDGKSLTIYDPVKNLYGVMTDVPKTIDETVDYVSDRFGVSMPLSDLIVSNLRRDVEKDIQQGDYLGIQVVAGARCHHLAFTQEEIDWQVWIEEGLRPLVRKIVITYKKEDQAPQFMATIAGWRADAEIPDYAFQFRAPAGASKIDVLPAKPDAEQQGGPIPAGAKQVPQAPPAPGAKPTDPASGQPQPPSKE